MRRLLALTASLALVSLAPAAHAQSPEGCGAFDPQTPSCEYTAAEYGGIGGYGAEPGGWKVEIVRKGERPPLVISSAGGFESYACGAIVPGDNVAATAGPGSSVFVGNPGICY